MKYSPTVITIGFILFIYSGGSFAMSVKSTNEELASSFNAISHINNSKSVNESTGPGVWVDSKYGSSNIFGGRNNVFPMAIDYLNRDTSLHIAVRKRDESGVKAILSGAKDKISIEATNSDGMTALALAIERDYYLIMFLLLEAGASPNEPFLDTIPLHFAVEKCNPMAVCILLTAGARVNEQNRMGSTALHKAVWGCDEENVRQLLMQADINVNIPNNVGLTPLRFAIINGFKSIECALRSSGAR